MADLTNTHKHQPLLEKTDNILKIFDELEKRLEEKPKVSEKKASRKEKEAAEKDYFKVDEEHLEQSPYVVKSSKPTPAATPVAIPKSKVFDEIEQILSDNLDRYYVSLDEQKKAEFKRKGEETASKIEEMVKSLKIRAKGVINLIKQWLSLVPAINKFFLEQEAKIKTQKIVIYARKYKRESKKNKW